MLNEREVGAQIEEICRRHGISSATYYRRRRRYGGLEVDEARRLNQLEDEIPRLKRIVTDQAVILQVLKDLPGECW